MIILNRALWIMLGFAGLIAVGIGAYGAHAGTFDTVAHDRFSSALLYHLVHLAALAAALILAGKKSSYLATVSAILFICGISLFSGSLYVSAFSGGTTPPTLAPYGGLSFMLGWLALGLSGALSLGRKTGKGQWGE